MATNPKPKNQALYKKAQEKVKRRVDKWPSARANQQVVQEYKKMGGTYGGSRKKGGLKRWEDEKWVDTKTSKPCGNKENKSEYCRPRKRVSGKTPKTASEMSASEKRKKQMEKKRINKPQSKSVQRVSRAKKA